MLLEDGAVRREQLVHKAPPVVDRGIADKDTIDHRELHRLMNVPNSRTRVEDTHLGGMGGVRLDDSTPAKSLLQTAPTDAQQDRIRSQAADATNR